MALLELAQDLRLQPVSPLLPPHHGCKALDEVGGELVRGPVAPHQAVEEALVGLRVLAGEERERLGGQPVLEGVARSGPCPPACAGRAIWCR